MMTSTSAISPMLFAIQINAGCNQQQDRGADSGLAEGGAQALIKGSAEHLRLVTDVSDADLCNVDQHQGDWLSYGRNRADTRYSELRRLKPDNLDQLGHAWSLDLGTKLGIQSTPQATQQTQPETN